MKVFRVGGCDGDDDGNDDDGGGVMPSFMCIYIYIFIFFGQSRRSITQERLSVSVFLSTYSFLLVCTRLQRIILLYIYMFQDEISRV